MPFADFLFVHFYGIGMFGEILSLADLSKSEKLCVLQFHDSPLSCKSLHFSLLVSFLFHHLIAK